MLVICINCKDIIVCFYMEEYLIRYWQSHVYQGEPVKQSMFMLPARALLSWEPSRSHAGHVIWAYEQQQSMLHCHNMDTFLILHTLIQDSLYPQTPLLVLCLYVEHSLLVQILSYKIKISIIMVKTNITFPYGMNFHLHKAKFLSRNWGMLCGDGMSDGVEIIPEMALTNFLLKLLIAKQTLQELNTGFLTLCGLVQLNENIIQTVYRSKFKLAKY